ncbi:formyl transferase [Deferribacteraceae bacterium V6Fe1]|nr:formyl transferase [Deferribacteraceae bacterium V6Fe1]
MYNKKLSIQLFANFNPNLIISYNYRYIISKEIVNLFRNKIINLHISLLPYNRGAHPNVWSFIEDTPKGVTIHMIDEGLDTGDIIFQKELQFDENEETFFTTYDKLNIEIQNLFKENWGKIKTGSFITKKQDNRKATIHKKNELDNLLKFFGDKFWHTKISDIKRVINEKGLI